ncbi:hypothetical protein RvY_09428 [Ramazzottius varieornatus]|uniref:DUF1731 domain-containing protein n=1 Tax=Ramazzottius varieornatus TaxID=947166 RepID=A0A1D1V9B5_RAMVA|nr:hypothetical protein RvY_09428 [Ramazzottius varieornatus]
MAVLIGGGSGFIGRALAKLLRREGYFTVCITRHGMDTTGSSADADFGKVISWSTLMEEGYPDCSAVINLSGANIMDLTRRWTDRYKYDILTSRVNTTRSIVEMIKDGRLRPKVFVTASGVGFYEQDDVREYDESSPGGTHDFLAKVCRLWEDASVLPKDQKVRVVNIRTGAVLGQGGGVIKNLYWPFFFGVGGPVGSGKQPFPWIHLEDITHLYKFVMENDRCSGVYNGVAPQIITNGDFTRAFAKAMNRPAVLPTPPFILNAVLNAERATVLTEGQRVHPKRTVLAGYQFLFPDVDSACKDVVSGRRDNRDG